MDNVKKICNDFILGRYSIREFQSRLHTVLINDNYCTQYNKILEKVDNEIESIIYCDLEENQYKHTRDVAYYILREIEKLRIT